jgi:hypothetical protein
MSSYFKNFPLIDYPNVGLAKNIVARPKIDNRERIQVKYDLTQALRPDQIADRYYKDEDLDWAIYIANDVVDPYYEIYLDDNTLNDIIIKKYGSLEAASQQIVFWETNWRVDDTAITPGAYNSLPADAKPYYNARTDGGRTVTSYVRKRKTIYKATNIIVRYATESPINVEVGENVILGTFQGRGTVVSVDDDYLTVQHILDSHNVTQINGINVTEVFVIKSISDTEAPYYRAVTAYEAAVTANDLRRHLRLIPSTQAENLRKELKRALA